jgi:tetratricopeptide (TPR) repeat protein
LVDKRYYPHINAKDDVMPDSQEPAQFCYESLTCFHAWVHDLTDGEATLYSMLVAGTIAVLGWLIKQLWAMSRKKEDVIPTVNTNTVAPVITVNPIIRVEHPVQSLLPAVISNEPTTPEHIHSDRLPTVKGGFFGREVELQLLNKAWSGITPTTTVETQNLASLPTPPTTNTTTRIIQFIAPGGTGKTKLLRHWLDHTADIPVLIAWSFYSQGSSEDKQTSATPFFSHAFAKLDSTRERFTSEEDKGDHLAELLHGKRYVLVLDGLEPLQHGGAAMRGELKDKAIRQLLRQLARHPCGLCIITTRIALHELSDRAAPTVIRHDLQNLTAADGIQLLESLGVTGSAAELGKAVGEYGGHALTLSLLGNAVRRYLGGDILRRDTIRELNDGSGQLEHHAFKVMRAYETWLTGTAELKVLYLLGLFDHPIEREILHILTQEESQQVWKARFQRKLAYKIIGMGWWKRIKTRFELAMQAVNANNAFNDLVSPIQKLSDLQQRQLLLNLQELGLLFTNKNNPTLLDCHPLIREYFGGQLQTQQPQAWQQAHERLYEYYKALPKNPFPDTLEEMQPLFSAVAHGCAAGLHQQAAEEVYYPHVRRSDENYLCAKLGAFSDDLATVAHFFTPPWHTPASSLREVWQAWILSVTGFDLRALGRLREALEPMQANIEMNVKRENWKSAAINASNLSELKLTLGDVAQAVESGTRSSRYADQSGDWQMNVVGCTIHADALHQAGDTAAALALFREAEQLQQEHQPSYPRLYSLRGFRYCDLLLAQGSTAEVLERYEQWVEWRQDGDPLLDIALDKLTLGCAHLQQLLLPSTSGRGAGGEGLHWLEQAVAGLRAAGQQQYLPLGLLARAALHRHTRDFARARQDLQEVFEIADGSGMRLHLTDYHLEMARLLVAEEENPPQSPFCKGGSQEDTGSAVPPFEKGGLGGISLQAHIEAAAKLINETGYHRRDPELLELQQALAKKPES